ncbi:MAG TPA: UDP-N-acetylmuramate dehydrogenase, partial [Candidatus Paceibacterota bacterium]
MEIRENIILASYTTFRIGGPAKCFCEVESVDDLKSALKFSRENDLNFFILGGGSNILVSDEGFDGLAIKMSIKALEFKDEGGYTILSVGAGENWDYLVEQSVERNLSGVENLSLIPGTVGAAVYQNIGAYGVELKDVFESCKVLDTISGKIKDLYVEDCVFGYRDSIFKHEEGANLVILGVKLKLSKTQKLNINYSDLTKIFEGENPSVADVRQAVVDTRKRKLIYPDELGNAGSFFKNPIVTTSHFENLILIHPDLKGFKLANGSVKLFVAQLIEKLGWKGKKLGNVGVSEKHSLVLVNYGKGTAEEVLNLADKIKKDIWGQFGVKLESEVQVI